MSQTSTWTRKVRRTYVTAQQVANVRKSGLDLSLTQIGSKGGVYVERGRLVCRTCGHLAVNHRPLFGCDVLGCACSSTWPRRS